MNRFQQVSTFRKSAGAFGVGERVTADGRPATIALVYSQDGRQAAADVMFDDGSEACVSVRQMTRAPARSDS